MLGAAAGVVGFGGSLWAATSTFTFTQDINWSNQNAWLFGNIPGVGLPSNDIANFTGVDLAPITPLVLTVTLDTNETVAGLVFSDNNAASPGGYLLTRAGLATLTLANSNSAAQPFINVGNLGNNPTISFAEIVAPLHGNQGFIKNGTGILRLSADNSGLTGTISLQGGTLEITNINNLGSTNASIELGRTDSNATTTTDNGRLSLRSDSALNLSSKTLFVNGSSQSGGFNVLDVRALTPSLAANITHTVGTVAFASGTNRQLNITGGNAFGLNINNLVLDPTNTAAVLNNLTPGLLTIGNVVGGAGTTASTITLGGTNPASVGSGLTITNSVKQTNGGATLSVTYSDAHTLNLGSFDGVTGNLTISGNGTLNVLGTGTLSGALPKGVLTVAAGSLDFSAAGTAQTVSSLVMGTTTNNQSAFSYINSGSGTLAIGGNGNVTYQVAGNSAQRAHDGGTIDGKLDFGAGTHSIIVNGIGTLSAAGTAEILVNADTAGSGILAKSGTGELRLTGNNTLSAALNISAGTVNGAARATGNSLTTGAVTISGGTLRLSNFAGVAGAGSIGALLFDGGASGPAYLIVDSGAANAVTTLNIGSLNGRISGSSGALVIIPAQGGLNTTEIITVGSYGAAIDPANNHGILAPYVTAQKSAADTSVDFLSSNGTLLTGAVYFSGSIDLAPSGGVYATNGSSAISTSQSLFAVKADGTLANIGGGTLNLGDGTLAGLILNNGANISAANLRIDAPEAIFWAGGRQLGGDGTTVLGAGGTISSKISFANPNSILIKRGAESLTFTGTLDFGGSAQTIAVHDGTLLVQGPLSNGHLTKTGQGYLVLTDANSGYTGTLTAAAGTLQVGLGSLTSSAGLGNARVNIGDGALVLNLDGDKTLTSFITSGGTGNLVVDSPSGILTFANATSNFSRMTIQSGQAKLLADNQLPSGSTLTVQGTGQLDLNGFSQTLAALAGVSFPGPGIITNGGANLSTLTLNIATGSPDYGGLIQNGVAGIAIDKTGAGTQILSGTNNFVGGIRLLNGTMHLQRNSAAGSGSIVFIGGNLMLSNGVTISNTLSIGNGSGTVGIASTPVSSSGTLTGPVMVGNGGTLNVVWNATGQALNVPDLPAGNFSGTVAFPGSGSGTFRIVTSATAGSTFDLSAATLNFGNSTTAFGFNQGSVTATMPYIIGGSNATIGLGANSRTNRYIFGAQSGDQVFNGTITDGGSPIEIIKAGSGSFTLTSATSKRHGFTGDLRITSGTFTLGNNATLSGTPHIRVENGTLAISGNGTITSTTELELSPNGALNLTQVPNRFATPPSVTVSGSGGIFGSYFHNAGTLNPGGSNTVGTLTFNSLADPSALAFGNGVVKLDVRGTGTASVGGGINDLLYVNGDVNFNPATNFRLNYIGGGAVTIGDEFPIIIYTGSKLGFSGGQGSVSTTSGVVSSPYRLAFVLKDLGNGVIAAKSTSIGEMASDVWIGGESGVWDLNFTKNFNAPIGTGTTFFQQDTVTFDNNGQNRPNVILENAIFVPSAVIFNNGSNSVNYTLSGNGTITGYTGIQKNNTGSVLIQTRNTYTGNTTISNGALSAGDAPGVRYGSQIIYSPFGLGTVYLGNASGTSTVSFGSTTFVNDIRVGAGMIGNVNFSNGSATVLGAWKNDGTINLTGAGGNLNLFADNSAANGTVNVVGSSIALRLGSSKAAGNLFWNFISPRTMSALDDAAAAEIQIGGLSGSGELIGLSSGALGGGEKIFVIGGRNLDSNWNGKISDGNSGASGSGATGIPTQAALAKTGTASLILTGVNLNYSGDTVVRQGVLQLSNTGGAGNTPQTNGGRLIGTRAVRVQNGGTFRLGQINGTLTTAGTITTASSGLLLSAEGGTIDVQGAYDNGDGVVLPTAFTTGAGTTWAGSNGTIIGSVQHSAGTISPGRDPGYGAIGTLTFADDAHGTGGDVHFYGGAVTMDIGSTTTSSDRINAKNLILNGGTVVVNVIGPSAPAGSVYTLMQASQLVNSSGGNLGLDLRGRGASGVLQENGTQIQLKILTPATVAIGTWNGSSGATWDVAGGQNWSNHTSTQDYFYQGDTVRFSDSNAGTVILATSMVPAGEVLVNNSGANTYTFAGPGKITGAASLHKAGSGMLVVMTNNDYAGATIIDAGGTLAIGRDNFNDPAGSYTTSNSAINGVLVGLNKSGSLGTGSIINNGALVFRRADSQVITQNISGSGAVYLRDLGVVELRGINTYSGGTTVSWGTLRAGRDNAFPTSGSITLLGTTNFLGGSSANATGRGGRIDLNGFNQTIDELNAIGDGGTPGKPMDAFIQNTATLSNNISVLTINRTGTLGFNSAIRNGTEGNSAPIGQIALTKNSNGVATMNYTATGTIITNYSGTTTINGGTLIVRGIHAPAGGTSYGTYLVNTGAALAGDGNIDAKVIVNSGGIIAPGISGSSQVSTLTLNALALNAANLSFDLSASVSDRINVNGNNGWTLAGSSSINLNVTGSINAGTFTLVDYSGATINNLVTTLVHFGTVTNGGTFNFYLNNNVQNSALELIVTQPIVAATWQTTSGTWSTTSNWNPSTPNAPGSTANFQGINSNATVALDGPFAVSTLNFNANSAGVGFNLVGSNITTLNIGRPLNAPATVAINVTQGTHAINVPVVMGNDGIVNVNAGATFSIGGGSGLSANGNSLGHNLTKTGAGTFITGHIRNTFANNGPALLNISQGQLKISYKTTPGAAEGTSKVNSLAIAGNAKLDLTNNSMVLDYYPPTIVSTGAAIIAQLRGWLNSNDARLFSSDADATHGLGYKDNIDIRGSSNRTVANFGGVVVDATSVLIKYTYLGDTNVDGKVDISDLFNLATNYAPTHAAGTGSAVWQTGDFNYDGWVDLQDLTVLATNWQKDIAIGGAGTSSPLGPILASLGLPQVAVPEPSTIGLIGLGLTGLLARRRRRALAR